MTIHNHMSRTRLWFHSLLLPEGWADNVRLTLADGRVETITRDAVAEAGDEHHEIGLPGLPNLHSHAFQHGIAGFTEQRGPSEDSFWTWREAMYRFVDRMEPEDVEAIAAQAFLEMLEGGFTRVGEFHYVHHDTRGAAYGDIAELASRIAAAASATGIALTLLPVFYAHAGFGGQPAVPGQRRFINDVDRYGRLIDASRRAVSPLPDAIVGIAPHSLRAATPEEIAAILPLAADGPVHIHIAEQTKEVEDCLAWSGKRPVELLLDRLPVDEHWCLVHATHVTDAEVDGMIARRAVAGLCPITEANLGDGIFPARRFLDKGGRFGVGSDSNVLIDAAEELRLLEYGQRLVLRSRNALASTSTPSTGRRLFDGALAGGGQALGVTSGIAVGASADFISLQADDNALVHRRHDQWLDAWIFSGRHNLVDCVWRAGRKLVTNGRHVQREVIGQRYRQTLARMLQDA
ncbi:MAG: formimidoylglutamate deiminase [Reyranella sp.]|nr:MAG: formimidoylglutamate deiminase [Reyranella sp.]